MVFGDKSIFAIECALVDDETNFINLGYLTLWIDGIQIGRSDDPDCFDAVVSNIVVVFIEHRKKDVDSGFCGRSYEGLLNEVWNDIFVSGNNDRELISIYYKMTFSPNGGSMFDDYMSICIRCNDELIFVWCLISDLHHHNYDKIFYKKINFDYCTLIIDQLVKWYEQNKYRFNYDNI